MANVWCQDAEIPNTEIDEDLQVSYGRESDVVVMFWFMIMSCIPPLNLNLSHIEGPLYPLRLQMGRCFQDLAAATQPACEHDLEMRRVGTHSFG